MHVDGDWEFLPVRLMRSEYVDGKAIFAGATVAAEF